MRCGKIIYPDATFAHKAMLQLKEACPHCKKKSMDLRYYYCEVCVGYHLTQWTIKQTKAFHKSKKEAWKYRRVKE